MTHSLTDEQLTLAQMEPGRSALVAAPPGSGKTRLMIARLCHLIDTGLNPSRISLVTFTRAAANELHSRIDAIWPTEAEDNPFRVGLFCGTMANYCWQWLITIQLAATESGTGQRYTPIPAAEVESLMLDAARDVGVKGSVSASRLMARRREILRNARTPSETKAAPSDDGYALAVALNCRRMLEAGCVDHDLAMNHLAAMLLVARTENRIDMTSRVILLDEAQDCDWIELSILACLRQAGAALWAVGDPWQSIYGWRGADPALLATVFAESERAAMTRCFRFGCAIGQQLDRIMSKSPAPLSGERPARQYNPEVASIAGGLICTDDEVAAEVSRSLERCPSQSHAVLCRTNALVEHMMERLRQAGVPVSTSVGSAYDWFTSRPEFIQAHALLRLIANPNDLMAWARIWPIACEDVLGKTTRFLSLADVRVADALGGTEQAGRIAETVAAMLSPDPQAGPNVDRVKSAEWTDFLSCLDGLQANLDSSMSADMGDALLAWPLPASLEPEVMRDVFRRMINGVRTSFYGAATERSSTQWFNALMRWPECVSFKDDRQQKPGGVYVGTVHSAKGGEWDHVLVCGLNEGIWPPRGVLNEANRIGVADGPKREAMLSEEWRLLYVAASRPRLSLLLHAFDDGTELDDITGRGYRIKCGPPSMAH